MSSMEHVSYLFRWLHFFFGIMWIGHLYYFNFTQGTAMAASDATVKSGIIRNLVPTALYWFRWGAMWTMATGLVLLGIKGHQSGWEVFASAWGVWILIGSLLGLTMWANVWFVIWPAQKIVIASAVQVAGGGQALPEAAAAAPRALLASRSNTLMSIPMLFFMGAATHLPLSVMPESNLTLLAVVIGLVWAGIEGNALKGKLGPMTTVKGVITSGFVLTAILYGIVVALV